MFSSVQLLSQVWLFATPWTAVCQASPHITKFRCLLKLMSIESVMPSNHFILCRPLLLMHSIFPRLRVFPNESVLWITESQSTDVSPSASVPPMNIQDWFLSGLTGWIASQFKHSQESSPTPLSKIINSSALTFLYSPTLTSIHVNGKNHRFD